MAPDAAAGGAGLVRSEIRARGVRVGFVVNIKGKKSHAIIEQALQVLLNLDHRGLAVAKPIPAMARAS